MTIEYAIPLEPMSIDVILKADPSMTQEEADLLRGVAANPGAYFVAPILVEGAEYPWGIVPGTAFADTFEFVGEEKTYMLTQVKRK